ncbi:hypothetical protein CEV33_2077 [Brucella grignonensis]|uniref:Uncharacterized protein n=1 Tax=Brucella grignonensis TaxID=94627 RepID=A0A256F6Y4_9HYPH|nr:hypothetical protein CEV33_2077 [Brucella grignonensis]
MWCVSAHSVFRLLNLLFGLLFDSFLMLLHCSTVYRSIQQRTFSRDAVLVQCGLFGVQYPDTQV